MTLTQQLLGMGIGADLPAALAAVPAEIPGPGDTALHLPHPDAVAIADPHHRGLGPGNGPGRSQRDGDQEQGDSCQMPRRVEIGKPSCTSR